MERILLTPALSDAIYEARFVDRHFELLAHPVPVYRSLLRQFEGLGASLDSFRIDTALLSTARITCNLYNLDVAVNVGIERLDLAFRKLHQLSEQQTSDILLRSWKALTDVEPAIKAHEHNVTITVYAGLDQASYPAFIGRYVNVPDHLGRAARAGAVFYLGPTEAVGAKSGSVVVDRVAAMDNAVLLKISMAFDGTRVPVEALQPAAIKYVNDSLEAIGLGLAQKPQ